MAVRVLLVEGNEATRVALARQLGKDDRVALAGATGVAEEAAQLLGQTQPDLVLLGARGSDERAVYACRMLSRLSGAPVVLFVSFVTPEFWTAAQAAGAADYLLKEIDTERLVSEIVRLAEQHAPTQTRPAG